jgi:CRP-like cAMP-binding protein
VRKQSKVDYDADSDSIFFPITQEILGDTLGLTNVHVNRMLKELKTDALIECRHRRLSILDRKRLTKIAQFDPATLEGHPLL